MFLLIGRGVHRWGDGWATHCCGDSCHGGVMIGGSGTVLVNGLGCARTGDSISCGDYAGTGSGNVGSGG